MPSGGPAVNHAAAEICSPVQMHALRDAPAALTARTPSRNSLPMASQSPEPMASDPAGAHGTARLTASCGGPLRGDIAVPSDKSMSHRALLLGGLAEGETRISGLLEGQDVLHTASAVRAFGADVERLVPGTWRVRGTDWTSPPEPIDCGNSGTGARLLMGYRSL